MEAEQRPSVESTSYRAQTQLRLGMAGSIALLFHAAIAALLSLQPDMPEPETTVQLQLVTHSTASAPSKNPTVSTVTVADQLVERQQPQPTDARPVPEPVPEKVSEKVTTPEPSDRAIPEPHDSDDSGAAEAAPAAPEEFVGETPQEMKKMEAVASSSLRKKPAETAAVPSRPSNAGSATGTSTIAAKTSGIDTTAQRTTRPDAPKMDPYILTLSRHMFQPLKRILRRGPTLTRWNEAVETDTRRITIELRLLSNGAVRRVRLMESSGSTVVDQVAVQSALAASPYPPPPEKERRNGFRFKLDLVMAPIYL